MCWTYFKTIGHNPVTRGESGAKTPLQTFLPSLEKSVGPKKFGPLSENLSPPLVSQAIVTGLIGHSLKIWAPLRKLYAPPGVPSWLWAWAKPSDGLAFLTYNRDVTLILRWLSTSCSKKNAD